jgi:hypothetical protein
VPTNTRAPLPLRAVFFREWVCDFVFLAVFLVAMLDPGLEISFLSIQ